MRRNDVIDAHGCGGLGTARPTSPAVGRGVPPRRCPGVVHASALVVSFCALLAVGCSTTPRVVEVSSKTYDRDTNRQRQDYFVRWVPATVGLVKFEYRQVGAPNKIVEQTVAPQRRNWTVFEIESEDFRSGGAISAWRVSLWSDPNTVVAEKRSAMW